MGLVRETHNITIQENHDEDISLNLVDKPKLVLFTDM